MNVDREPDLTSITFEDTSMPVNRDTWREFLARSNPGFYDPNSVYGVAVRERKPLNDPEIQ